MRSTNNYRTNIVVVAVVGAADAVVVFLGLPFLLIYDRHAVTRTRFYASQLVKNPILYKYQTISVLETGGKPCVLTSADHSLESYTHELQIGGPTLYQLRCMDNLCKVSNTRGD